ncbi:MAG: undecaprenyl-diphosphatase UppP [Chloroflexota bacterium]
MNVLHAILLGLVQGLTEFIPISSTAHLTLFGSWLGLVDPANPERWTSFMAVIQLGTLAAVFAYFRRDIISVPLAFYRENISKRTPFREQSADSRMAWLITLGTIPIVVIGLAFKDVIEGALTKDLHVIGIALIGLALLLALAEFLAKFNRKIEKADVKDSLVVGFAQCLALIPGASRSGTTLTAGMFLGFTREDAARFSFLLSIPAIFASGALSFVQSLEYIAPSDGLALAISTLVAGVSGYASIAFLLRFLKKNSTALFIVYRIALGAVLLFL